MLAIALTPGAGGGASGASGAFAAARVAGRRVASSCFGAERFAVLGKNAVP